MKNSYRAIKKRILIITAGMVIFWCFLVIQLFSIQIIHSNKYKALCEKQADYRKEIAPIRGILLDRNNKPLTVNSIRYSFAFHPYLIDNKVDMALEFSQNFGRPTNHYLKQLKSDKTFVWLKKNVTQKNALSYFKKYKKNPGIAVTQDIRRQYPLEEIGGQLLGFTNIDNKGITGLELILEPHLSGEPGWQIIQKDGWGRPCNRPDLPFKKAIDGSDVSLTIDLDYQMILHEELYNAFKKFRADKAMGLLIDPRNGEILAIASCPTFNPNKPSKFSVSNQKNSVITDIFEPGSTFKIVAATCALEKNLFAPADSIDCSPGYIRIANRNIHDHEKYDNMSFSQVFEYSSNVGTIKIANEIGKQNLHHYAQKFGFGSKSNIKFPGEENGILHSTDKWTELLLAQVSIGHGISCTALQLAYAYASIANGGLLLKPMIVKSIQTKDNYPLYKSKPEVIRRVASKKTMDTMCELLRLTVRKGTGIKAEVNGMAIAGKTGTAQKVINSSYSDTNYVATFTGFFPADNPKLLCVTVIDNPRGKLYYGGSVAAPVVKEVFKRIVNVSDELFFEEFQSIQEAIKYTSENTKQGNPLSLSTVGISKHRGVFTKNNPQIMPNLYGQTSRKVLAILSRMNIKLEIKGSGKVIRQEPKKGTIITPGTQCVITLQGENLPGE